MSHFSSQVNFPCRQRNTGSAQKKRWKVVVQKPGWETKKVYLLLSRIPTKQAITYARTHPVSPSRPTHPALVKSSAFFRSLSFFLFERCAGVSPSSHGIDGDKKGERASLSFMFGPFSEKGEGKCCFCRRRYMRAGLSRWDCSNMYKNVIAA